MIYFTSDEHYGAQRTLELSKRPFKTVEEMDQFMINQFNSIVTENDITIHVGDFGEYENLSYLNGKHFIVLGNYEQDEYRQKFAGMSNGKEMFKNYLKDKGFNQVYMQAISGFPIKGEKETIMCYITHKPENCIKDGSVFNIFGHIHGRQMIKRYGLDVGVDAHHFRPVSLNDILFYKEAIDKYYDDNVFE